MSKYIYNYITKAPNRGGVG